MEKAVEIARSYEQVKMQMGEMQDNSADAVTGERKETTKHSGWKKYPQKQRIRRDAKSATNTINLITVQQKKKITDTEYSRNKEASHRAIFIKCLSEYRLQERERDHVKD